ncbi:MAG: hypothetical protein JWO82_2667 [Akkermansiaceae bacterium]|nr:hypothetical protein [Akkermansiaceae bacterium]
MNAPAPAPLGPLRATCSDGFLMGLESLMRRTGQGHHLACTVVECAGEPDLAALRRAAELLGRKYPILQARLSRGGDWLARWELDRAVAAAVPLETWNLEGPDGLRDFIEERLNGREIDIHRAGANLRLHVVALGPERWALVVLWSHSLHDAVGIDKLLREIAATGSFPEGGPVSGGLEEPLAGEPVQALYRRAKPMIEEMRTFPAWRVRSLHRKGVRPGRNRVVVENFDLAATAEIRAKMAKTAGELLLLPYFACCAARAVQAVIAARHPGEEVPVLLSLPVQRQGDPDKRPLFQNHMAVYTLLMSGAELAELKPAAKALFRKYADFMRRKLPTAMDALMQMMERCPSRFYNLPVFFYLKGELCTLFHSHTGSFAAGLEEIHGSRVLNGYHVPSVCTPPGIGIFFSEYAGQLSMTLSWRDGCLAADELALLRATLHRDLFPE